MKGLKIIHYLFLLFFLQLSLSLSGQDHIVINDSIQEINCAEEYIEILEDKDNKWTINDVSNPSFQKKFTLNKNSYPYNENTSSVYWIKFKIVNHSTSGKGFLIESFAPHTNDWQVYYEDNGIFKVKKSGLNIDFYSREYVNKNLILDLPLKHGAAATFYIKVHSKNHSSFDFRIKPQRYFFYYSVNEYFFLGIFYGILLIMAIYNLLMYFAVLEKIYIYYVFYVICGMLTTLSDDGIGYQYIWTAIPGFSTILGPHIAPPLLLLFFTLYSREFLNLKKDFPNYDRIIVALVLFYFLYHILKLTILPLPYHSHIFYIIPFIAIYIVSIIALINGMRAARFFVTGFSFILASIIIIKLRSNGTIEGNLFTVYSLNYGLVLEVLVLSFAMTERFRYAKKEREKALKERNAAQYRALRQFRLNEELKDKVNQALSEKNEAQQNVIRQLKINEELKDEINKELEFKVRERTIELNHKNEELERANERLKELTEIAHKMSLKLDVDNWNLQKEVQETIKARMKGQEISYDEFIKTFPDLSACIRYLNELKWGASYKCRKCTHTDASEDLDGGGKKCLKCGYYESVTAHTIFHGIKFPIQKAFFITYLRIHKKDNVTLDKLAEMVDLNRNTCWKFTQKIESEIEEHFKSTKNKKLFSWEDIIYPHSSRQH